MTTGTAPATFAAAIIGLTEGRRLLCSSAYYSDFPDRISDWSSVTSVKSSITVASSSWRVFFFPAKAVRERPASFPSSFVEPAVTAADDHSSNHDLDALLLQKSMLETQWNLCIKSPERVSEDEIPAIRSGLSTHQRRISAKRKTQMKAACSKPSRVVIVPELLQRRGKGYVRGELGDHSLTRAEVVHLSEKIKAGLSFEDQRSRLEKRLGYEPSDEQLAYSLKISCGELRAKTIETKLARDKLAMSNVRLVMYIAQRYENMGVEMSALVQGGLIGLLRGIEKFDSSKGFKISTYVYWWIRQGVPRALIENSRILRLPTHLHERLGLIRNAKLGLEAKGIAPSVNNIAKCLNISQKKVRNATEVIGKVFSLDTDAFPLPERSTRGNSPQRKCYRCYRGISYIAGRCVEMAWCQRMCSQGREIIRLYYGLDGEYLTWEDISKRIGLFRERVRQLGLVALGRLGHIAWRRKMQAMLQKA